MSSTNSRVSCLRGAIVGVIACTPICLLAAPTNSVSYQGVTLSVQDAREVETETLQVTVKGETFLVAESEAGRAVARRVLQGSAEGLSPSIVSSLAVRAAQVSDGEVLGAALAVIFRHDDWKDFDSPHTWQDIAASEVGRARIVSAIHDVGERQVPDKVCASLRALYEYPPTLQVEALAKKVSVGCLRGSAQQAIRELFLGRDRRLLTGEIERLAEIFGDGEDSADKRALRKTLSVMATIDQAFEGTDAAGFEHAITQMRAIGELFDVPAEGRDASLLREQFVVRALEKKAFGSVFSLLPSIQPERRTPALHSAVLQAIDGLTEQEVVEIMTPPVQEALGHFAERDEEISLHYQRMVTRGAEHALAQQQPEIAYRLLHGSLSAGRELPVQLARIAERIVVAFIKQSDTARADQVAASLIPRLGLGLRIRLALARVGISLAHAAGLALLVLIGTAFVGGRRVKQRHARVGRTSTKANDDTAQNSASEDSKPKCSEELAQALASFGLSADATLAEIKNAYRMRVKECHPDRNPEVAGHDNSDFVRLTTEYDRLLMLYQRERASDK